MPRVQRLEIRDEGSLRIVIAEPGGHERMILDIQMPWRKPIQLLPDGLCILPPRPEVAAKGMKDDHSFGLLSECRRGLEQARSKRQQTKYTDAHAHAHAPAPRETGVTPPLLLRDHHHCISIEPCPGNAGKAEWLFGSNAGSLPFSPFNARSARASGSAAAAPGCAATAHARDPRRPPRGARSSGWSGSPWPKSPRGCWCRH